MAGRYDVHFLSIRRNSDKTAMMRDFCLAQIAALREVKISGGICFKVHHKLMILLSDGDIVIEVLVEIRFAIAVQIVEAGDLITSQHIHLVLDDLQAERLKHAGGKSFPG